MHAQSLRTANLVGAWALVVADAVTRTTERETGLGGAVPAALVTIGAYLDQSIEELRGALGLSQPGTVRLVDRLEAEGWVRRRPGRRPRTVGPAAPPRPAGAPAGGPPDDAPRHRRPRAGGARAARAARRPGGRRARRRR